MKNEQALDIYEIKKSIKDKHSDFMHKIGFMADQVVAEHSLKMAVMHARITAILYCLIEENIINTFEVTDTDYSRTFILIKHGAVNRVNISICPFVKTGIVLRTSGPHIELGNVSDTRKYICESDDSSDDSFGDASDEFANYDWKVVALDILDIIHDHIYQRKIAMESSFFNS